MLLHLDLSYCEKRNLRQQPSTGRLFGFHTLTHIALSRLQIGMPALALNVISLCRQVNE